MDREGIGPPTARTSSGRSATELAVRRPGGTRTLDLLGVNELRCRCATGLVQGSGFGPPTACVSDKRSDLAELPLRGLAT